MNNKLFLIKMYIENSSNPRNKIISNNTNDRTKKINHYLMSEIFDYFTLDELFHLMQINKVARDCVLKMKLVKHLVSVSIVLIICFIDDN